MRKFVLAQFAVSAVLIALIGSAAFGILLLDFQSPGLFKVWAAPKASMGLNLLLVLVFGLQHSLMARRGFKRVMRVIFPPDLERSFYVMLSGFMLLLMAGLWVPTLPPLYDLRGTAWQWPLHGLALGGVLVTVWAGISQGGLDLLGIKAVADILRGKAGAEMPTFRTPGLYRYVRHPLYLGFLISFWATPAMTHDHLLFAEVMTAYVLVGTFFEERDLVRQFGEAYRDYQRRVPMLIPFSKRRRTVTDTSDD